jgi:hypothetical protein
MRRLEEDPPFVAALGKALRARAPLFRPAREVSAWRGLLADLADRGLTLQGSIPK